MLLYGLKKERQNKKNRNKQSNRYTNPDLFDR